MAFGERIEEETREKKPTSFYLGAGGMEKQTTAMEQLPIFHTIFFSNILTERKHNTNKIILIAFYHFGIVGVYRIRTQI